MNEPMDCKVRQRTFIAASPEQVYDTITDARKWDEFFTTGMVLDPRPGGVCTFSWENWGPNKYTQKAPGKVVDVKRPGLFVFQWGQEGNETTIRFEMSATEGGTVISLTEDGYKNTPEGRAMMVECASGWAEALTLLKFFMEHGIVYNSAVDANRAAE